MHDLTTINRLNLEAFAESIERYRRQGGYVLAVYAGLSLVSIETFSEQAPAFAAFEAYRDRKDSEHAKLFFPISTDAGMLFPPIESHPQPPRAAANPEEPTL